MNTTRDVLSGSNLGMGSGSEVESAAFHTPVSGVQPIHSSEGSSLRSRIDDVKNRSLTKVRDVRRNVSDRSAGMKGDARQKLMTTRSSVKRNVSDQMTKMQSSMRTSPAKWAAIAAGSGFAIGMASRFVHWRNQHQRRMPELVIIESTC